MKVAEGSERVAEGIESSLSSTGVVTVEEVEDCIEQPAFDGLAQPQRDFCIYKGGSLLKVNVFGKCECRQRCQWRMTEFGMLVT